MRPSFVADRDAYYAQQFSELTVAITRYATAVPIPVPTRQSGGRALTGALSLLAVLSAALAAVAGYAGGALLPLVLQPYTARLFTGAFALLLLSMFALVFRLIRLSDGGVRLYLTDRERFLTKLQTRYTNRLKPPFEGAVWLVLGLSEDVQAVARPSLASQEGPATEPHPLPADTSITTAFESAEGQLLILGAPGAGKSWLLYQLAQNLVGRAHANGVIPIPVVFNLASWAQDRKSLEDWMADQLVETWQVPQTIARVWVERRQLLPLLDGLDEVRQDARDACVEAINRYQRAHGLEPLAVCCRKVDYDALEARLDLRTAVVAEPLTPEQIDTYLAAGGESLAALQTLAREDTQMQDLLSTPLLLSVITLAYEGKGADAIPNPDEDKGAWTQAVFRDYVPAMLARRFDPSERAGRKRGVKYPNAETTRYLAWLAMQMRAHERTDMFYVEQFQIDWLPIGATRERWDMTVDAVFVLAGGLSGGMAGSLIGNQMDGPVGMLILGLGGLLFCGLGGWLIRTIAVDDTIFLVSTVRWKMPVLRNLGCFVLWDGEVVATLVGMLFLLLFLALIAGPLDWGFIALVSVLVIMLGIALVVTLGAVLLAGLRMSQVDSRDLSTSDEGLMRSLRSGLVSWLVFNLVMGLVFMVVGGLVGKLVSELGAGLSTGLGVGLVGGFIGGLAVGLVGGLGAFSMHQLLRRFLEHLHLIPPHYIAFLDFAADHVLLQRVGGGYRFIHALLLDYFADQWPDLSVTPPKGSA